MAQFSSSVQASAIVPIDLIDRQFLLLFASVSLSVTQEDLQGFEMIAHRGQVDGTPFTFVSIVKHIRTGFEQECDAVGVTEGRGQKQCRDPGGVFLLDELQIDLKRGRE